MKKQPLPASKSEEVKKEEPLLEEGELEEGEVLPSKSSSDG